MQPNKIILHCTATRPEWWADKTAEEKMQECERWHLDRGFRMIGYHFLVDRDGTITEGRPLDMQGAHCKGQNKDSIGIAMWGGFGGDSDDLPSDHFTAVQHAATKDHIPKLQKQIKIKRDQVFGHNRFSSKACPSFRVQKWMSGMSLSEATVKKPEREKPVQSKTVKASAATIAASAGTTITALAKVDQTSQYIILGFAGLTILFALVIMRERLKAWAEGWH